MAKKSTSKKPKIIIQQLYDNSCMQLMVRIDEKFQLKSLLSYLNSFIMKKRIRKIFENDLSGVFYHDVPTFYSNRIVDGNVIVTYLVIDEGNKAKLAFIYLVISSSKKEFKKIDAINIMDYFEP